jgi:hypothetical protein
VVVLGFVALPYAQAGAGRTAAQFLSLGGGTRAAAMGEAYSTSSGDVMAILWNPSGLAGVREIQTAISYNNAGARFGEAGEGIYYGIFAAAFPAGDLGVFGLGLQLNGQGVIDVTFDSPEVVRQESLGTNWALTLSYADEFLPNLYAGASGRIIRQKLGPESATAYAADIGLQYRLSPITLGVAVQNWGTRIQFKDANQSDPLPRTMRMGLGLRILNGKYHKARLTGDLVAFIDKFKEDEDEMQFAIERRKEKLIQTGLPLKSDEELRREIEEERGIGIYAFKPSNMQKSIGLEYWFADILALRVGYKDDPYIAAESFNDRLNYGFGIRFKNYQFDYASIPGGGPNNVRLNTFDLLFRF